MVSGTLAKDGGTSSDLKVSFVCCLKKKFNAVTLEELVYRFWMVYGLAKGLRGFVRYGLLQRRALKPFNSDSLLENPHFPNLKTVYKLLALFVIS